MAWLENGSGLVDDLFPYQYKPRDVLVYTRNHSYPCLFTVQDSWGKYYWYFAHTDTNFSWSHKCYAADFERSTRLATVEEISFLVKSLIKYKPSCRLPWYPPYMEISLP